VTREMLWWGSTLQCRMRSFLHKGRNVGVRRLATSVSAVVAAISIASDLVGYLTTGAQFFSNIENTSMSDRSCTR
jgi:hypothetical protein